MSSLRPVSGTTEEILGLLRAWDAAPDPDPLIIATSGSTGRPKQVVLSRAALRASAAATEERLGGPGRWLLNLPAHYVAGVQVLFRSLRAGQEPVVVTGSLADTVAALPSGRTYLSLVATQLVRALADRRETEALSRLTTVLIGGGPLRPAVRAEAEAAGIRIVQTYGMSETCGGCVYDGVPLDGVRLRIDADGAILLAGPVLFDGYLGEPERTAAAFRGDWFHTNDLGSLGDDGRLRVEGRADRVLISGGVKVPATAVAEQIVTAFPDLQVEVVGVPDEEWGQRVIAVVASAAPGRVPDLAALRDVVQPRPWAPRGLRVVGQFPLLESGKVDLRRLEEWACES